MNTMTKTDLFKLPAAKIKELLPLVITSDGEIVCVMVDTEKVLLIDDLHPRVQIQLKARETLARSASGLQPRVIKAAELEPVEA
jgi:hypothetical protein